MQLEEDKPVSELMVPNKMNEEEANETPEESKALDPNALARLNLGSGESARKPEEASSEKNEQQSANKPGAQSPDYSEFDQDKTPVSELELGPKQESLRINAPELQDKEKPPARSRYVGDDNY